MARIAVGAETSAVLLVGHGLIVREPFELALGMTIVQPPEPALPEDVAKATDHLATYVAVLDGQAMQHFAIRIDGEARELAVRSWNALWTFHLLSLAVSAPVWSLYSLSVTPIPTFGLANRQLCRPADTIRRVDGETLSWAKLHLASFGSLIDNPRFSIGMRAFGNSQGLHDDDLRIMLLWSGIDALLAAPKTRSRETLSKRAGKLLGGSEIERDEWYQAIRQNYEIRNLAVHGAGLELEMREPGRKEAERIIIALLRRCVELGSVPSATEMDAL